jgi:hypothetical protein
VGDGDRRRSIRTAVAFAASGVVHLLTVLVLLAPGVSEYSLPTPPETPPVEMEIIPPVEVERPPPPPGPAVATPVAPRTTPQPPQPQPQPQPAEAPKAAPPKPIVVRPLLAAPAAARPPVVAKTAPSAVLEPTPLPSLAPEPTLAPPAPSPSPTAPKLNIHKSQKEAPSGTPTLPMAPSPALPPAGGGRPAAGGEPALGGPGSRLQGLTPYPGGVLPNGGGGLRGSLVGCANAQAVALSSVERAHCESRFGAAMANAPHLDGIPPDKRSAFDREVGRADKDRAYRNSTTSSALTGLGGVSPDETRTTIRLPQ